MLAVQAAICCVGAANAADDQPRASASPRIPAHAVAFYSFDPTAFEQKPGAASLLPTAVRIAESSGLIAREFFPIFDGLAAASVAGTVPHSLALLEFDGVFDEEAKNDFRITDLQLVLTLDTASSHRTYIQTLTQILDHYDGESKNDESQTIFQLTNGVSAGRFIKPEWERWQAIEWASLPDAFLVGIGAGALDAWIDANETATDHDAFAAHWSHAPASTDVSTPRRFITTFINFERLHLLMPEVLAQGRPRRMLETWKLDNARRWFFHGRRDGRFLLFDLTWEGRSDPRGEARHRSLSTSEWPDEMTLPEPPGELLAVFPMDFEATFARILQAYRSTLSPGKLEAFDERMRQYEHRHRTTFNRLWDSFKPFLIVSNYPKAPVRIPGASTLYFELAGKRTNARAAQNRMEALIDIFMDSPDPRRLGDSAVRFDRESRMYYLQLEKSGTLRLPSWGWAENRFLIGGWGPPVVTANREWLENQ